MPIGCYGGETFGMSEARCKPIQSEIDKAIRMVSNVGKSAAIERIRDELGITSVFKRTYNPCLNETYFVPFQQFDSINDYTSWSSLILYSFRYSPFCYCDAVSELC
ncbi:hypothetical protein AYI70_g5128 [Smittium culicis]|uniref:Uncharacterized protein n=1 Tax=Smittium culicis TaxID=133412 RepID=A0A1R1XVX4_9FUNG|nr:hypothetical protein AYI70_g5128 [Smittium culicis]